MERRSPGKIRKELEIEERQLKVSTYYLRGWSYRQIGLELGCGVGTVHRDIESLLSEWREQQLENTKLIVIRELTRIDTIEQEAWKGWLKSTGDSEEIIEETGDSPKGPFSRNRTKLVGQSGDPRFLNVVLGCVQERCKILGVNAPMKIEDVTAKKPMEVIITKREEAVAFDDFMRQYGSSTN